jgi:hypothetical protein
MSMEANKDVLRALGDDDLQPTIRHRPHRHICGDCGAPWTDEHTCPPEARKTGPSLRTELRRLTPQTELEPRPEAGLLP